MADRLEVDSSDRVSAPRSTGSPNWARRMLTLAIAIAAIGGFALIVVYSYDQSDQGQTGGNAPVITAHNGPTKVRPDDPGGMPVPNRDKQVYGQLDTAKRPETVERLLPPPEPVARKPEGEPPVAAAPAGQGEMEQEQARVATELSRLAPAAGDEKTSVPAPPPAQAAAVPPEPAEAKSDPQPVAEAAPAPAAEKRKEAASSPVSKMMPSPFRIQIAALRSEDAAKKAWERLAKGNKDLLGKLEPDIVRIELAGKGTFYRLQAGPVDDATEAKSLCSSLKKRKIGCLVVRP